MATDKRMSGEMQGSGMKDGNRIQLCSVIKFPTHKFSKALIITTTTSAKTQRVMRSLKIIVI